MSLWNVLTGQNKETPGSQAIVQELRALERRDGLEVSDQTEWHWEHSLFSGWYIVRDKN